MNATTIARKEFTDTLRSRMLWALTGLFVALTAGGVFAFDVLFEQMDALQATHMLSLPAQQVIPLAGLVVGYLAIAGERESGSIRILLGQPTTRRDVVFGKLLGRTAVVSIAVVAAFLVGGATVFAVHGDLAAVDFLVLTGLTALFALAYVGVAVGISATTATRARAMAGAITVFAVFSLLWSGITAGIHYAVEGNLPAERIPGWYLFLLRINPANAYDAARQFLLGSGGANATADIVRGTVPVYAQDWVGFAILVLWIAVPVTLGYLRFRAADLG